MKLVLIRYKGHGKKDFARKGGRILLTKMCVWQLITGNFSSIVMGLKLKFIISVFSLSILIYFGPEAFKVVFGF